MATKPKKQKTAETVDSNDLVEFGTYAKNSVFAEIPVEDIMASPTNPRKVFHEKPLDELADSIKRVGVLEPVLVRLAPNFELVHGKRNGKPGFVWENLKDQLTACWQPTEEDARSRPPYEIIAGERRWRASQIAGLYKIPVIIKDLSDEQTLEVQIDENWQRKDLEPMDEARGLKFIMDKRGWSLEECAARLSKDVRFLAERLKLNELIEECQTAMDEGKLLVTHAYVIARYSETDQKQIVKDIYGKKFERSDVSLTSLKSSIAWRIEKQLAKAVFDLKAIDLRTDGLACVDCPQRAGANPTLFDEIDPADDRCLNSKCFTGKTEQHWLNLLAKSTKDGKKKFGPDYEAVCVYRYNKPTDKTFANAIGAGEWCESINDFEKGTVCDSSETAIFCGQYDTTREIKICRNKECPDHAGKPKQANSSNSLTMDKGHLEKKFEREVREAVAVRIVTEASLKFVERNELSNCDPDTLVSIAASVILPLMEQRNVGASLVEDFISRVSGKKIDYINEEDLAGPWLTRYCTPKQLNEVIFLCIYGPKAHQGYSYNPIKSASEIIQLAETYGLNYRLYDAQERVRQAISQNLPIKEQKLFENYLSDVVDGKDTKIPRVWDKKLTIDDAVPVYTDEDLNEFVEWEESEGPEIDDNAADGNSDANDELTADSDKE